ncbi:tyrosine-type recombinase/integrase, partial [candidate division GN15 bacterium]|nr:tyrosine-type recombinase/integrase [candidate division GN15 bacterium]
MDTVTARIEDFLQHLQLERGLSDNTVQAYRTDLAAMQQSCRVKDVTGYTPSVIATYFTGLSKLGRKPATLARKISSIKHFFEYLKQTGVIRDNPAHVYAAPRIARYHPDYLSPEEIESIIKAVDPKSVSAARDRAVIELLYGCGLRLSELIDLRPRDIELEAGFVRVTGKGSKQRLVPLGRFAGDAVVACLDSRPREADSDSTPLILNRFGKKFSRVGLWQVVKK